MTPIRTALLFILAIASGVAAAQGAEKRYPLPGHGALVVTVPKGWSEDVRQNDKGLPPTIFYSTAPGRQQVMLNPIWRARADMPPFTAESMRQNVEQGIKGVREQAQEKNIRVIEFAGRSGPGYYFEATDKAPKPGEFKFLRQGMLKVGDLLVAFNILANGRDDAVMRDAMQMLSGAAQAK